MTIQEAFGTALRHHQAGRLAQAEEIYRQILAAQPKHADALHLLGVAAHQAGRNEVAVDLIRQAIALRPDWPEAYSNLAVALQGHGQFDEAAAACRTALALKSDYPEACYNLGNALKAKGQLDEAIAAYRQAIALRPKYFEALGNLGSALKDKGLLDEAIAAYREQIALAPESPEAHGNLGNALKDAGLLDKAIAAYRKAIALKPDYRKAHGNLLLALHYHSHFDAHAIAEEHRRWNRQHAHPTFGTTRYDANDRDPDRRIRIGYVSPDFRGHAVAQFLLPLLTHHDPARFEVFAYAHVAAPDAMTQTLRSRVNVWRDIVGLSDARAADLIRRDRIDILVDLAMHTGHNRLSIFARKPAPVQVTYLAYCSTTGLDTIDYRLSDPYLDPPGADESCYSEKTVRLPETFWCYQPALPGLEAGTLPAAATGYVTFGCLNNFCKVTEPALAAWARILGTVPNSRLLLHAYQGSHRQRALLRLEKQGVDPRRVRFVEFIPAEKYFDLYRGIDIALDTFPFGGGTTTCDALWMGVPVITLVGRTAVGRGGLSILSNIGLAELAARSEDEYVRLAGELAGDLPRLRSHRAELRQRMEQSPLMDGPRFARNIEAAYRRMWRRWCIGSDQ